jgi:hypothetical protein
MPLHRLVRGDADCPDPRIVAIGVVPVIIVAGDGFRAEPGRHIDDLASCVERARIENRRRVEDAVHGCQNRSARIEGP